MGTSGLSVSEAIIPEWAAGSFLAPRETQGVHGPNPSGCWDSRSPVFILDMEALSSLHF